MCGVAVVGAAAPVAGQQPPIANPALSSLQRDNLRALIGRLERAAQSPGYSPILRARAQAEVLQARTRLEEGDFQVGDRLLVIVLGEPALSDTLTVAPGRMLQLPQIGTIPLRGVLHAELESYLTVWLARFIRDPQVLARSTVRVAIVGAVAQPGFYSVPLEALLGQVLMAAGGPGPKARVESARLERGGREVLSASAFRQAVVAGRTLDQLDVRAGDRIVVPERAGFNVGGAGETVRTISMLLSLPLTLFAVTQVF